MTRDGVHADAYYFGAIAGKLFQFGIERRQLDCTHGRPVRWIKHQYDILLSPVVAQLDALFNVAHHGGQIEIRGLITYVYGWHSTPPVQVAILESGGTARKSVRTTAW